MNADHNPFRRSKIEALRYKLSPHQMEQLLSKLNLNDFRGAIIGPHGSGKSTLLEDIQSQLNKQTISTQHFRVHKETLAPQKKTIINSILNAKHGTVTFLDGGENLGLLQWIRLARKINKLKIPLIATTHYPCPLPSLFKTAINVELCHQFTQMLAGAYWSPNLEALVLNTFKKHKGNMREVFRACYLHLSCETIKPLHTATI